MSAGTYSNSLSISVTGIDQTAQVLLNLTLSPVDTYTLAVRLLLATPEREAAP
ncbi:MAG: hypothetical protein IPQ16_11860 [Geobacteraceae bacterium]|nr:hypothetical protein [Geobacteraceae bacterium]